MPSSTHSSSPESVTTTSLNPSPLRSPVVTWVTRSFDQSRADVLKVGHHGSSTSSSDEFLAAVRPRLAVISVGALNKYGHPSGDVIQALHRVGADVLRTDEAGTIVIRTDGVHVEVEAKGEKWELARESSRQ